MGDASFPGTHFIMTWDFIYWELSELTDFSSFGSFFLEEEFVKRVQKVESEVCLQG